MSTICKKLWSNIYKSSSAYYWNYSNFLPSENKRYTSCPISSPTFPVRFSATNSIFDNGKTFQNLHLKKRQKKSKNLEDQQYNSPGAYNIMAFPTAEEINLEDLVVDFVKQVPFKAQHFQKKWDFVKVTSLKNIGCEPQELFILREGAVVVWNVPLTHVQMLLSIIQKHEQHRYTNYVIHNEAELISYRYNYNHEGSIGLSEMSEIVLSPSGDTFEKYIISHALASAVKLGVWERQLEKYIQDIEFVTEDLKYGKKIKITQGRTLRKHGALFALRHVINLSSNLIVIPEIPYNKPKLEALYEQMNSYYGINKRLRLIQDKMTHCIEIVNLLSLHLRDKHRLRLEWLVIVLVLAQLAFEIFYCIDRVYSILSAPTPAPAPATGT